MPTLISKVFINAFYYPEPAQPRTEAMMGYIKAAVNNRIITEHGVKWAPNPYYHVFFIPFTITGKEYSLQNQKAFTAQDVTPAYWNVLQIKWEMIPLKSPDRQQPQLEAIILKLNTHLPEIVQQAILLKGRKQVQRRRFLGQFPRPLREGIDEKVMYGTISKKETNIEYNIYKHDLSTYAGEDKIPHNPSPHRQPIVPVKFF